LKENVRWRATSAIINGLKRAGYCSIRKGERFIVKGSYGPLRDGELERARRWVWARSSRAAHHSEADFLKISVAIWTNSCYFNIELQLSYFS
jgi:hypothetical protein